MLDEGTLRERSPEIPWDQPVEIHLLGEKPFAVRKEGDTVVVSADSETRWVCRYCIAFYGIAAQDVREGRCEFAYLSREEALDHIERVHHD